MLSFTAHGNIEFNQGDILILSAALICGFQIIMFDRQIAGKDYSLINITLIELLVIVALGLVTIVLTEPTALQYIPEISFRHGT